MLKIPLNAPVAIFIEYKYNISANLENKYNNFV